MEFRNAKRLGFAATGNRLRKLPIDSSYRSNASPLDTREDGPMSSAKIGVDALIFRRQP